VTTTTPPPRDPTVALLEHALSEPALGSNPFDEEGSDPFLDGLELLGLPLAPAARTGELGSRRGGSRAHSEAAAPAGITIVDLDEDEEPTPLRRSDRSRIPRVADVELPDDPSWLERLIDPEERQRIAALSYLVDSETGYDRYGLSPQTLRRAFPFVYALYRLYFRVQSEGHEFIPSDGAAILAANHGGLLPVDGAMVGLDCVLHPDPPRLPRAVVDVWAGSLPWINVFYARMGQVIGTRENFADLLSDGQLMLVFPEGMDGAKKTITQRYRLQRFRVGFVEQALVAGAPIVPVAVIGSDDQTPILYDAKSLARRLGLPTLPITPTFPWLGPLGLLPYPVNYHIIYGEPFEFHREYGPNDAEDPRLVRYLAGQVRHRVQQMVDRHRS
jgi:1-acyl-sn-glycerol-3-phosphate acyltransferase